MRALSALLAVVAIVVCLPLGAVEAQMQPNGPFLGSPAPPNIRDRQNERARQKCQNAARSNKLSASATSKYVDFCFDAWTKAELVIADDFTPPPVPAEMR